MGSWSLDNEFHSLTATPMEKAAVRRLVRHRCPDPALILDMLGL